LAIFLPHFASQPLGRRSKSAGVPKPLFKVPPGVLFWDTSPDGKRFLMVAPPSATAAAAPLKFTVVLNWPATLNK